MQDSKQTTQTQLHSEQDDFSLRNYQSVRRLENYIRPYKPFFEKAWNTGSHYYLAAKRSSPVVTLALDMMEQSTGAIADQVGTRVYQRLQKNAERLSTADVYGNKILDRVDKGRRSAATILIKPAIFLLNMMEYCFTLLKKTPTSGLKSEQSEKHQDELGDGLLQTYHLVGLRAKELGCEVNARWGHVVVANLRKIPCSSMVEPKLTELWHFTKTHLFEKEGHTDEVPMVPDDALVARRFLKKVKDNEINLRVEHSADDSDDNDSLSEADSSQDEADLKKKR